MGKFTSIDICKLQVGVKFDIPYLMTHAERHTLSQQVSRVRKQYPSADFDVTSVAQLDSNGKDTGYYKVSITRLSWGCSPKGEREPQLEGTPCNGL